ncbi:MAG: hypothetical protein JW699_04720 [Chitinispirillaceae bacterium]|nr:hypothetical protein [Chitinispirillaceae bacterium]
MMRKAIVLAAVLGIAAWAGDPSEKGVPLSPLRIYSGGLSAGGVQALTKDLQDEQKNYLKLSLQNSWSFRKHGAVFFDINWFLPGINPGLDIGFDIIPFTGAFRPLIGAGIGGHYFDKSTGKFGDKFGPSATVHAGFSLDLTDRAAVRVRVPYYFVGNESEDQLAGVEVGFMFSPRFKHVKKLNYY